jgi:hypothetical protein
MGHTRSGAAGCRWHRTYRFVTQWMMLVAAGIALYGAPSGAQAQQHVAQQHVARQHVAQQHAAPAAAPHRLTVVLLGTGPTAPDARPAGSAISVRLQQQIDSIELPFHVASVGRYGESSAYAVGRLDSLVAHSMDVFVLETGSGDAVRGLGADSTRTNIRLILHRVRAAHPESWVCLVREIPPTALAPADTAAFRALYGSLARSERAIVLPTPVDSLWPALEPILRKVASLRLGS